VQDAKVPLPRCVFDVVVSLIFTHVAQLYGVATTRIVDALPTPLRGGVTRRRRFCEELGCTPKLEHRTTIFSVIIARRLPSDRR
jgi:hypothetical protein